MLKRALFSAGYKLYTSYAVGYSVHRAFMMSSASSPAKPHTVVTEARESGAGESAVAIRPVAVLGDNYSYILAHASSRTVALVDPADPAPILAALKEHYAGFTLSTILTTHKHWDHAGGNLKLLEQYKDLVVIGGKGDGVAGATRECGTGDEVHMATGFTAQVMQCPCHTRGHIVFQVGNNLFTGDTLFTGGCGKFFEGNAREMHTNLYKTLGGLDGEVLVWPGHEYTESNLEFARWVEPDNAALKSKESWVKTRRASQLTTIPSTMAEERSYNPFLRVREQSIQSKIARVLKISEDKALQGEELEVQVLDALRTLKNENAHKKAQDDK